MNWLEKLLKSRHKSRKPSGAARGINKKESVKERIAYRVYLSRKSHSKGEDPQRDWEEAERIIKSRWRRILFRVNTPFTYIENYCVKPINNWLESLTILRIVDKLSPLLEAIGVIAIPVILAITAQRYQQTLEDREEERLEQTKVSQYLSQLSTLVLDTNSDINSPDNEQVRALTRATTLALLRDETLDSRKKEEVIEFLLELKLLQTIPDNPETAQNEYRDVVISLSEVDLSGTSFSGINFDGQDFSLSNLSNVVFSATSLYETRLFATNFNNAYLAGADFRKALLFRTDFSEAYLESANFSEADSMGNVHTHSLAFATENFSSSVTSASLEPAVVGSRFIQSNLRFANLSDANFSFALFSEADFASANLNNTIFLSADFEKTKNLAAWQFSGVGISFEFSPLRVNLIEEKPALLCNTRLPTRIIEEGIDPNRDCESIPDILHERYGITLESAQRIVNEARKVRWE